MSNRPWFLVFLSCFLILFGCTKSDTNTDQKTKNWELIWSDEFNYYGLPNPAKWNYDIGDGCPDLCGWGNNELQYYSRDSLKNARVENGNLILQVHEEKIGTRAYSSAKLVTRNIQNWQYGKIEVRAKLPKSKGVWSAIWMLPVDMQKYGGWPASGEIDIMENVGFEPGTIHATVHTKAYNHMIATQKTGKTSLEDGSDEFHIYSLEWDENSIRVNVDDSLIFEFENEQNGFVSWPFDQPYYLILNIAYGGSWGGQQGLEPEKLPQQMEIDYVRVFEEVANSTSP